MQLKSYGITFVGMASGEQIRSLKSRVFFFIGSQLVSGSEVEMMEIPNRNFSNNQLQWRRQTSTELAKTKVFLQRVEQENNQITQIQKNIGYTFKKRHVLYVATICGTFCSAVFLTHLVPNGWWI